MTSRTRSTPPKKLARQRCSRTHPPRAPSHLRVDASGAATGAVIEQYVGSWMSVAIISRKLRPAEQIYSSFVSELLAMYLDIRHIRYFPKGRTFTLCTDHKHMTIAMYKVSDPWSARQQMHLAYISEFTADVRQI